jgi:hypothetical protein
MSTASPAQVLGTRVLRAIRPEFMRAGGACSLAMLRGAVVRRPTARSHSCVIAMAERGDAYSEHFASPWDTSPSSHTPRTYACGACSLAILCEQWYGDLRPGALRLDCHDGEVRSLQRARASPWDASLSSHTPRIMRACGACSLAMLRGESGKATYSPVALRRDCNDGGNSLEHESFEPCAPRTYVSVRCVLFDSRIAA